MTDWSWSRRSSARQMASASASRPAHIKQPACSAQGTGSVGFQAGRGTGAPMQAAASGRRTAASSVCSCVESCWAKPWRTPPRAARSAHGDRETNTGPADSVPLGRRRQPRSRPHRGQAQWNTPATRPSRRASMSVITTGTTGQLSGRAVGTIALWTVLCTCRTPWNRMKLAGGPPTRRCLVAVLTARGRLQKRLSLTSARHLTAGSRNSGFQTS